MKKLYISHFPLALSTLSSPITQVKYLTQYSVETEDRPVGYLARSSEVQHLKYCKTPKNSKLFKF